MTNNANPPAATIRARVHQSALKRVTKFWASRPIEIFLEALQNSRRAGATRVHIAVETLTEPSGHASEPPEPRLAVTVTDDGAGIEDPAVLLSFGENGWNDDLVAREDAAGMGILSLAHRGCRISSRACTSDSPAGQGWFVDLEPEHFTGRSDALVRSDDGAPYPSGTAIRFEAAESADMIRAALASAARHYPLPVTFEGETLERRAFLDGAVHAEAWNGLAFGVYRDRRQGYMEPDLNFFGLTVPVGLPMVDTVHGANWSVRADVVDCPGLELVLPARREAVENGFLAGMREAARLAIYRAMAADSESRPAFADWTRARDAGIHLVPPPRVLRPWRPAIADIDDWREPPKPAPAGPDALVIDCDPEPPEAQALWRAAERVGMAERLFEADTRLEGYEWYDRLDRVTGIDTQVTDDDGKTWPLRDFPAPERKDAAGAPLPQRPAAIRMTLSVTTPGDRTRTLHLPADLAFVGEAWSWIGDALPLVTRDSTLEPCRLAELLRLSFFSPSDDADADSWSTQAQRFDEDALHVATRLLHSEDSALELSITETVRREILHLVPNGRKVEISIRRPDVRVVLGDPAQPAA
ncbi:MAG: ATP-binding protein [Deltaproteobacteria bacterium]|nr:ATP-binding protein [Deltaproteobacteria bacterium]